HAFPCRPLVRLEAALGVFISFAVGCILVVVFLPTNGSSLSSAWENLITIPSGLAGLFTLPLKLSNCLPCAIAALLGGVAAAMFRSRSSRWNLIAATAKAAYGFIGAFALLSDCSDALSYLLPWTWLLAVPVTHPTGRSEAGFARIFICFQAV